MSIKTKYGLKSLSKDIGGLTFGKLLRSHRLAEEYSQKDFAELLEITQSSLCDLEKGRKIPTPSRAMSIARSLGLSERLWIEVALQDQLNENGIKLKVSLSA